MNQDIAESWENLYELKAIVNIFFFMHSVVIYKYLYL